MVKFFFVAYVNLVRSWLSPLLYWILRLTKYRGKLSDKWNEVKNLSMKEFYEAISPDEYSYKPDPLKGRLDFSPREKDFFFLKKEDSRDCDDWARMWYWYHQYHNREAYEISMLDVEKFSWKNLFLGELPAHKVTVARTQGEWRLFDYAPVEESESSINGVLKHNRVSYEDFIWTKYGERPWLGFLLLACILLALI